MKAFGIMTTAKIAASADATGRELAFYMALGNFRGIVITEDDGEILGIVSEQDLLNALNRGCDLASLRAEDMMTREVVTVEYDTALQDIIRIFAEHHVLNLPVVHEGKLIGVVERGEALRAATQAFSVTWVA
jgi:CBS domain-containing protein